VEEQNISFEIIPDPKLFTERIWIRIQIGKKFQTWPDPMNGFYSALVKKGAFMADPYPAKEYMYKKKKTTYIRGVEVHALGRVELAGLLVILIVILVILVIVLVLIFTVAQVLRIHLRSRKYIPAVEKAKVKMDKFDE
jgi:hypothetical protein